MGLLYSMRKVRRSESTRRHGDTKVDEWTEQGACNKHDSLGASRPIPLSSRLRVFVLASPSLLLAALILVISGLCSAAPRRPATRPPTAAAHRSLLVTRH